MMKILERLVGLYAPECCIGCGIEGRPVCEWCWPDLIAYRPSTCYRCDTATDNFRVCKSCRPSTPLRHVWIASEYTGGAKQLVRGLKYGRKRSYGMTMARLLDEFLPFQNEAPLVVFVPTTAARHRQRGFDQSAIIAKALARLRGWEYVGALRRVDKNHQVGLTRKERLANNISFAATNNVDGRRVLLVDDVVTTGHTVELAAKVLLSAGATTIDVVAVAGNRR